MVDCNTLNLTRRGGRKGLAIGSGRGDRVELDLVYLVPRSHWDSTDRHGRARLWLSVPGA